MSPSRSLVATLVRLLLPALLVLLLTAPAAGQTAWESPRLLSADTPSGLGLYWVRFAAHPGDGSGGVVTWSPHFLDDGLSLRAGAARGSGGVLAFYGGVDATGVLGGGGPLRLSWNAGAGLAVGDYLSASVPVGLAAGRAWAAGPLWVHPYLSARVSLDAAVGARAPADRIGWGTALDVGLDLARAEAGGAGRVVVRVSASLGDRSALALGVLVGGMPGG